MVTTHSLTSVQPWKKDDMEQIAVRDHYAVHSVLPSPDPVKSSWPVSTADQLTNKYVINYRRMSKGGHH